MKLFQHKISILALAITMLFASCESVKNSNNTQKGVAGGAVAGAIIGGILGNNLGSKDNAALGAIIGAAVGGATGGLIGAKMDKQARDIQTTLPGAQVERVGEGIRVILDENAINFDFNKSTLTTSAKGNLDKLIPVFNKYPDTNILIVGHTDAVGSDAVNDRISLERATSVRNYMSSKGITATRMITDGKGKNEPLADNTTEEGRAKNRRVEFAITANEEMVKDAEAEAK